MKTYPTVIVVELKCRKQLMLKVDQNTNEIFLRISALASKKKMNKKK